MRTQTARRRIRRRTLESGVAAVELVVVLPIFFILMGFVAAFFLTYFRLIGLTTVANDCAQIASMNWRQDWRDAQAQAVVNKGRSTYGMTEAVYTGPSEISEGAEGTGSVQTYCELIIVAPNGALPYAPEEPDPYNHDNLIRNISWPLQVHRSCYEPSVPAMTLGDINAPAQEDLENRWCDNITGP